MTSGVVVTLDVGGSHVTAAAVMVRTRALMGKPLRLDLPHGSALHELVGGWARLVLAAAADHEVQHVGLAVPGPFDVARGISAMRHKFPSLYGVPLRPLLQAEFRGTPLAERPILFGNDADLFALGEWWAGAGVTPNDRGHAGHRTRRGIY